MPSKKNVLLIISDDMNNRLGCYGDPTVKSPNIDALAGRGVMFDRAYCQYPVCNPSRASMLTGLYPQQINVRDLHTHFRKAAPNVVTLPQHFRNNGYFAARSGKIFHQGVPRDVGRSGLDDRPSWDETRNPKGLDKTEEDRIFSFTPGKFGATNSWRAVDCKDDELTDGMIANDIINMMTAHRAEPWFLACGFYRPHTPWVAPKKYFDLYPLESIPMPKPVPKGAVGSIEVPAMTKTRRWEKDLTQEDWRKSIRAYFAATSYMDAQVGRVLGALEKLGLEDDTIVIFWGDNGYSLGEHNHWQKASLYEDDVRTPLIMAGPGIQASETCPYPVELVDLYPSLAQACDLKVHDWLAGTSLMPQMRKPDLDPGRAAVSTRGRRGSIGYAIRSDRYRLCRHEYPGNKWKDTQFELFDYRKDPNEWWNLAEDPDYKEIREKLAGKLAEKRRKYAEAPAAVR